jgi:hypothetical protein
MLLQLSCSSFHPYSNRGLFMISVYVDSDAVRLYRAGKASGSHAGVWLAAPTVNAEVCKKV